MFNVINGQIVDHLPVSDRGGLYGDGIFETLRYIDDEPILFDLHVERFKRGAHVLSIPIPPGFHEKLIEAVAAWKASGLSGSDFVCKWLLTRGSGGRGYLPPDHTKSTLIFSFIPTPKTPASYYQHGISATICKHPLSINPVLAGLKHLNRLDQVIASSQLGCHSEGITCDLDGNIVEGTKSNVLLFRDNEVFTPVMKHCGVEGCMLQYLLAASQSNRLDVKISRQLISKLDLSEFEGIAFINSVFGLWPVDSLDGRKLTISSECKAISSFIGPLFGIH